MYIRKILERYSIGDCYLVDTLIAAGATEFIVLYDTQATDEDIELYRSKIGSVMYLAVQTRLDIAYEVLVLLRFLSNPSL